MTPEQIAHRQAMLAREEEGIVGLIPLPELAAIVGVWTAGVGLLILGGRILVAGARDVAGTGRRRP